MEWFYRPENVELILLVFVLLSIQSFLFFSFLFHICSSPQGPICPDQAECLWLLVRKWLSLAENWGLFYYSFPSNPLVVVAAVVVVVVFVVVAVVAIRVAVVAAVVVLLHLVLHLHLLVLNTLTVTTEPSNTVCLFFFFFFGGGLSLIHI